jgi:hypothetical protein
MPMMSFEGVRVGILFNPRFSFFPRRSRLKKNTRAILAKSPRFLIAGNNTLLFAREYLWQKHQLLRVRKRSRNLVRASFVVVSSAAAAAATWAILTFAAFVFASLSM